MKDMIIAVVAALIGIMIIGVSVYYLVKEKMIRKQRKSIQSALLSVQLLLL